MEVKEKIEVQTFDLIMKYGVKSVSMDDISRRIGISKKTIYQYFDNKHKLISEVIAAFIKKDEQDIFDITNNSQTAVHSMVNITRHFLAFLRSMSDSTVFDLKKYYPDIWESIEEKHYNFFNEIMIDNLKRGVAEGYYNDFMDNEIVSKLYIVMTMSTPNEKVFSKNKYKQSELFKELAMYHFRAVLTPKGKKLVDKLEID